MCVCVCVWGDRFVLLLCNLHPLLLCGAGHTISYVHFGIAAVTLALCVVYFPSYPPVPPSPAADLMVTSSMKVSSVQDVWKVRVEGAVVYACHVSHACLCSSLCVSLVWSV